MQGVKSHHPPGGVCMISGELTRFGQSMQAWTRLQVPAGSASPWIMGTLVGNNINSAFRSIMAAPSLEWAWLMGDDHTYEPDILLNLLDRQVDVIVPLCLNRSVPFDPTIIEADKNGNPVRLKHLEDLGTSSGLYRLGPHETCGDAGILVRRHVLEKIGDPWHRLLKSGSHNAEDREFIKRVKDEGFEVHVDLDNVIGHLGVVEYKPVRKETGWEVRISSGQRHVCDIGTFKR